MYTYKMGVFFFVAYGYYPDHSIYIHFYRYILALEYAHISMIGFGFKIRVIAIKSADLWL